MISFGYGCFVLFFFVSVFEHNSSWFATRAGIGPGLGGLTKTVWSFFFLLFFMFGLFWLMVYELMRGYLHCIHLQNFAKFCLQLQSFFA